MKLLMNCVLAISISMSLTIETDKLVNWISDDNTLPQMLPKSMSENSKEEIEKAVFDAYVNQMKIISEYSGHVFDPEYPYGYFRNEFFLPDIWTYQPEADLVFRTNVIKGLRKYKKNYILVKWAPDQIETTVKWENASIGGKYVYSNSTYYEQGQYNIKLKDLKYQANTTLSENTVNYPSMVPKSCISYESIKVSFSGTLPEVTDFNKTHSLKYFLEDIAFQHLANWVARTMRPNITIAVRQAIKPYVIFKNGSDPHFRGFGVGSPTGAQYRVDGLFVNGLNQTHLRVKNVTVYRESNRIDAVTAVTEFVMHRLSGVFDLREEDGAQKTGKARFAIGRINLMTVRNMLNSEDCTTNTTVHNTVVAIDPAMNLTSEMNLVVADVFARNLTMNKFNLSICKALALMYHPVSN